MLCEIIILLYFCVALFNKKVQMSSIIINKIVKGGPKTCNFLCQMTEHKNEPVFYAMKYQLTRAFTFFPYICFSHRKVNN